MARRRHGITMLEARILRSFLDEPWIERYGIDLMRGLGISSGSLYPALAQLAAERYLIMDMERVDPTTVGRPRRRNYRLNPDMAARAQQEIAGVPATQRRGKHAAGRRTGLAGA